MFLLRQFEADCDMLHAIFLGFGNCLKRFFVSFATFWTLYKKPLAFNCLLQKEQYLKYCLSILDWNFFFLSYAQNVLLMKFSMTYFYIYILILLSLYIFCLSVVFPLTNCASTQLQS